jgi:FkbM family methyltransferase
MMGQKLKNSFMSLTNIKNYISKQLFVSQAGKNHQKIYLDIFDRRARKILRTSGDFNVSSIEMWNFLLDCTLWNLVIDVGANYGEMLVWANLPKDVDVLAVEPNLHISYFLDKSLKKIGINYSISNKAISDFCGKGIFKIDKKWSGTSSLIKLEDQKIRVVDKRFMINTIEVATLSSLINQDVSDKNVLIKIDVEGGEIGVLKGALDLLKIPKHYAVMMEIIHLRDEDLRWVFEFFKVYAYNYQTKTLVKINTKSLAEFKELMHSETLYQQDVVLMKC